MSEHIPLNPYRKKLPFQPDKLPTKSPEFIYHAKGKGPMAEINLMRGMPEWTLTMFEGTNYEVKIPYRGYTTTDKALQELDGLTPDIVQKEPFNLLYRHMYMLQHIGYPKTVAKFISTIIDRVTVETNEFVKSAYPHSRKRQEGTKEYVYIATMACLEVCEEDPSIRIPKEIVQQLYHNAQEHPESWRSALIFDKRNVMYGESIDAEGHFREMLTSRLLIPNKVQDENGLLESIPIDTEFQANLLIYSLLQTSTDGQISSIIQQLAPVMGVDKIRKTLREYVEDNPSFRAKFDIAFDYLGFDPTIVQVNLARDIYEKIDFSKYEPNRRIQEFEIEFLRKELANCFQVLDVACGTGRHLEALDRQEKLHIAGIDIVQKHIDHIKVRNPQSDVHVGSWFNMPFPDKTLDAAYCLGRSFTHNTTIPDAVMCLQEMARIIKDDGFIILDLPDPNIGDYKDHTERTKKIVKAKRLKGVLPGMITDSPDLQHYFDRYAPDNEAFEAIAQLAGLHAEKLTAISYPGISGKDNVNTYWKLTKDKPPDRIYDHFSGSIYDKRAYLISRIKRERD